MMAENGNDVGGLNARYYFDAQGARLESTNKRLFILALILAIMLFVSNGLWVVYESQFKTEVTSIEATQDADFGGNNYIVGGSYGETDSKDN